MSDLQLLVDTNIASHFMRFPSGDVARRMRGYEIGSIGISIVAVCELRFGVAKVNSSRLHRQVEWLLTQMNIVQLETPVDTIYAEIRAHLQRRGTPIGANDLFIAAQALIYDVPLVTANVGEFSRVPGLRVENWLD